MNENNPTSVPFDVDPASLASGLVSRGIFAPICFTCKHFRGGDQCAAFPNLIPDEIMGGDSNHREPFEGDHGVQYERDVEQFGTEESEEPEPESSSQ